MKTRFLPSILTLSTVALLTCSSELEIEFRGSISDTSSGLPVSGVQICCMAAVEADTLVPFERDHAPALTQSDGTFRDLIEFNAGTGCKEVTDEDWLREGAYFKVRRDGYEPVDTFFPREKLTRVSGYYRLPEVRLKPTALKTPSNTSVGDR